MNNNQSGFRFFEQMMTILLFVAIGFFILYMVMAGIGAVAWKIIFAVLIFLLSGVCLFTLYTSQELLKTRSLWLTTAFSSLILCTLVSLLCNYPAP